MSKIAIIGDTTILKLRLEQVLIKNDFGDSEFVNTALVTTSYLNYISKEINLFIVDLDNFEKNGLEIIKMIRTVCNIPIIAMSEYGDVSVLKKVYLTGCNDFIIKPFNGDSLIFKVKKLLSMDQSNDFSPNQYVVQTKETETVETEFHWDKAFEIDVTEIDNEHRSIIQQYEHLYKLMKEGKGHTYYDELLAYLNDYVHTHFDHEERIHIENEYNLKDEHSKIHAEFKASVLKIYKDGQNKKPNNSDLIHINLFIKNWWIHHILIEDQKFGDFLKNNINT